MTRNDFQGIALLRLNDAEALHEKSQFDGCCYLAGYSIELALKAAICRLMQRDDFFTLVKPETARAFKIHSLHELIILAGLRQEYENLATINPNIYAYWGFINNTIKWSEQLRYQSGFTQNQATDMLEAIAHPQNGILEWIKNYW